MEDSSLQSSHKPAESIKQMSSSGLTGGEPVMIQCFFSEGFIWCSQLGQQRQHAENNSRAVLQMFVPFFFFAVQH